jgi:(p)ppGpp synthase/HD superfamily hydrolase
VINDLFYDYIKAIEFATVAHAGQTRRFGTREPYVAHPIRVSQIVLRATEALPLERRMKLATAAILHDVLEDTQVKKQAMATTFGYEVTTLVESVTKNVALPKSDKELEFLLRFKQSDVDTVLLKFADRLDNLSSMESAPADFRRKYIANTKQLLQAIPEAAKGDKRVVSMKNGINELVARYEKNL